MKNLLEPFIYGFGAYTPEKIVTNDDLAALVDTTDEWIVTRTGIKTRHIADQDQWNADLAAAAAESCLKRSGINREQITHILLATCTPDSTSPPTACILEHKLGIKGCFTLDINAACSGFVAGIEISRALAKADPEAVILLVASDILSRRSNWKDRTTCILFGDAAGAVIISQKDLAAQNPKAYVIDALHSSDGSFGGLLEIKGGFSSAPYAFGDTVGAEYFVQMNGSEVFRHAVRNMSAICRDLLKKNNMSINDIDLLVPHQANMRIIESVGSRLNASSEKIFVNVDKYGNTSAASIPLALYEAINIGGIKQGNKILLVTFGGGFTWAAAILQF